MHFSLFAFRSSLMLRRLPSSCLSWLWGFLPLTIPGQTLPSLPCTVVAELYLMAGVGQMAAKDHCKGNHSCIAIQSKLGFVSQGQLFALPFCDTCEKAFTDLKFRLSFRKEGSCNFSNFLWLLGNLPSSTSLKRGDFCRRCFHIHPCFPVSSCLSNGCLRVSGETPRLSN